MGQLVLLEVIVIDDGSTDGTAEELGKKFPEEQSTTSDLPRVTSGLPVLRLIRHEVSAGYIVRRNEGARAARGNVIFSLDDDAVFSSPCVVEQTLRDFSHPRIGAVAIPYIEPHKANREMQRAPTREDIWITASFIGTAHAVRRDVFLALGGYREHLVHQGEEGDFCLRMLAAELKNEAGLTTEHTEVTEDEAVLTTIELQGGRENRKLGKSEGRATESWPQKGAASGSMQVNEQPQVGPEGKGVGATESKITEGQAGPCLDKPSGAAFSNPSKSELARDSGNTSLTRSANGPALERIAPGGSGSGGRDQLADSAKGAKALDTRHSTLLHPLPVTLHSSLSWKRRCPASSSGWGIAIRLFIMSRRSGITRGWIFMEGGMMCFSIGRILRCRICSGSCQ